jgi:hypothetical protein
LLFSGFIVNLTGDKTDTTATSNSPILGFNANYIFREIVNGIYSVRIQVTPTGYSLAPGKTNPKTVIVMAGPAVADFPFISVTPTGSPSPTLPFPTDPVPTFTPSPTSVFSPTPYLSPTSGPSSTPTITPGGPSLTPTLTPTPGGPTNTPTPTKIYPPSDTPIPTPTSQWTPTPTITPGGPSLTPTETPGPTITAGGPTLTPTLPPGCITYLPTPAINAPAHETCTNVRPLFSAYVENPNNDSVWAHFYSDAYETFSRIGSAQPSSGGNSEWQPGATVLLETGGYWWTAYTESPSCPRSGDAPSRLITMDYSPPPQPNAPNCVLQSQNLVTGICTFTCSWPPAPEYDGSCANTSDYHPVFWTLPGSSGWDPNWCSVSGLCWQSGINWYITVTASDSKELYSQLAARDSVGNVSTPSVQGGPFTCPEIIYSPSITPGGPSLTPTITPTVTVTPSPTITLTPTPGAWLQALGGDIYQNRIVQPIPASKNLLDVLPSEPLNSVGILWAGSGTFNPGFGSLSPRSSLTGDWKLTGNLANTYNFWYYWEALKNQAKSVNNTTVGASTDLEGGVSIYSYTGLGYYTLDTAFKGRQNGQDDVTIFLISGSLEITGNFTLNDPNDTVVFVVNGNIYVDGSVTRIPGLYISSQTFTIAESSSKIIIDGMVYTKALSLKRSYFDFNTPAYQFIYQPKYIIALLPYLGRTQVNWQETGQ